MSEEEKKTINNMKLFVRVHEDMTVVTAKEMNIVLKLVEKQQEEIENLIARNKELEYKLREHICIEAHEQVKQLYIPKSKVREKIEFIKSLNEKIYYEENVISILEDLQEGDK